MKYPNTVCAFGMYSKIPSTWHALDQTGAGESGVTYINPLNAELNPICHLLGLLGAHHILHISRIKVN